LTGVSASSSCPGRPRWKSRSAVTSPAWPATMAASIGILGASAASASDLNWKGSLPMSATKILWGQITTVFLIILATTWGATQYVAWSLGYQPQLGPPWFELLGTPIYYPPAIFWWWYFYEAYAPP